MFLRETHEGKDGEDKIERCVSLVGFEGSERNGDWFLVVKSVGVEIKQLSAIDNGLRRRKEWLQKRDRESEREDKGLWGRRGKRLFEPH